MAFYLQVKSRNQQLFANQKNNLNYISKNFRCLREENESKNNRREKYTNNKMYIKDAQFYCNAHTEHKLLAILFLSFFSKKDYAIHTMSIALPFRLSHLINFFNVTQQVISALPIDVVLHRHHEHVVVFTSTDKTHAVNNR